MRPGHTIRHLPLPAAAAQTDKEPTHYRGKLADLDTWEPLDKPLLIKDREGGRVRYVDGTERFFSYIFAELP